MNEKDLDMEYLENSMKRFGFVCLLFLLSATGLALASPETPAEFTITENVLRTAEQVPPLGVNDWGRGGAIEWAANNFVGNAGNEPVYWQNFHRATEVGDGWFEIDGGGVSWWDLWGSGFLSGARARIYRIVDEQGNPLPPDGNNLDITNAHHVILVGDTTIVPEDSPGFPDGGWVVSTYTTVHPYTHIRHGNLSVTDGNVENGRTYYYTIVALGADETESPRVSEASATPLAELNAGPRILIAYGSRDALPSWQAGQEWSLTPEVVGGALPLTWSIVDEVGNPASLPGGVNLNTATGAVSGTAQGGLSNRVFYLRVTDNNGQHDTRRYVINPTGATANGAPAAVANVTAQAGNGYVTLNWDASPTEGILGYRILRATAPQDEQVQRVYLSDDAPALQPYDYIAVEKRFDSPFDMGVVNPRVRGIGNPYDAPNWYYNVQDNSTIDFALTPHPGGAPSEMEAPGETCLQVSADGAAVINQYTFIGTDIEGENQWYQFLEPGEQYRMELWVRQEGLSGDGAVTFNFRTLWRGPVYSGIQHTFNATGDWQKVIYDFQAPTGAPPSNYWHYGPALSFNGPGTLWMDNFRVYRWDSPAERDRFYVPNATVFDAFMSSQPEAGPKGAHRTWFLPRNTTMDGVLNWFSNSQVAVDWNTAVRSTLNMTMPMSLEFDRLTGESPETRVKPWFVMQHILHDEADWLNFIEYLAAPYNPETDIPESKPYAYLRTQQRGVDTPWTDEFEEILVEFGNETWHNGVFEDWIGFSLRNFVTQGGPEYGLFSQYLIDNMKSSPYWTADVDEKLRFVLGAFYNGNVENDGTVSGYGETAVQNSPDVDGVGHANYVGPRWETGDSSQNTFDDHGVQETLVAFLSNVHNNQENMRAARDRLAETHHAYDIMAYEGGPSGYALPGDGSEATVETNERYGKSLAMGVAALDAWLGSYVQGWTYQCYLSYAQGSHWSSHTPFIEGFRPQTGWLALSLRNRFASGDLVEVSVESVPDYTRQPGQDIPLTGCYSMEDNGKWSVFLLSRKLDGEHDGHDFGEGATPVTLNLPFESADSITLHRLTGDPRESNRAAMNIDIESMSVSPSALSNGTFTVEGGLPAGSIYLYVFETGAGIHSADTNKNNRIETGELLRVVQLFKAGAFGCDEDSEDGYVPGEGGKDCSPHESDYYPQDWSVSLSEVLRIVQFYNATDGAYTVDLGTEDGFTASS
jgi:hypothetical protein